MPGQDTSPAVLARTVADALPQGRPTDRRWLIAIAGPPAVGKSTIAEAVVSELGGRGIGAVLLPMDGFHLDNSTLQARGLLARKGAPETFDVAGFGDVVVRARTAPTVYFPTFDRARDIAIAGSGVIEPDDAVVVVEGNYLLLDEAGWSELVGHWDQPVFLRADEATLERRLVQRWLDQGMPPDAARQRAESNDLPNARRILTGSDLSRARVIDVDA